MPIQVKVINASLTRNTETVSNMDPYCLINVGHEYRRTTTRDQAGFNPVWNQILFFVNYDNKMRLQVFDADFLTDDLIGSVVIDIAQIYSKPNIPYKCNHQVNTVSLQLKYKQQKAGTLNIELIYLLGIGQMAPSVNFIGVPVPIVPKL